MHYIPLKLTSNYFQDFLMQQVRLPIAKQNYSHIRPIQKLSSRY